MYARNRMPLSACAQTPMVLHGKVTTVRASRRKKKKISKCQLLFTLARDAHACMTLDSAQFGGSLTRKKKKVKVTSSRESKVRFLSPDRVDKPSKAFVQQ